jgi:3-oxoacyl-[acyl-carrier-protein] synthase-1
MELLAVNTVFPQKCPPLISLKGYIGHTLGAAGVIETALLLEALRLKQYPASKGFSSGELPPQVNIPKEPVYNAKLDRILAMKAGFGGINAALVIESAKVR